MKEGTYYSCGCWHSGEFWKHPEFCPTHHGQWKFRYTLVGLGDETKQIIIERGVPSGDKDGGSEDGGLLRDSGDTHR